MAEATVNATEQQHLQTKCDHEFHIKYTKRKEKERKSFI